MKNMYLILTILFLFTGCNEKEVEKEEKKSIYGTWQLVEFFSHPPTGNGWNQVENGFKITIKTNNSFNSSQFSNCNTGNITLTPNQIDLIYDCNGFTQNFEDPAGIFKYSYDFIDNKLEFTPKNFTCFEGCKYRLIKITSEE